MKSLMPFALLLCAAAAFAAISELPVADFSALRPGDALPPQWQVATVPRIDRHTLYSLVDDGGITVLRAESDRSMSSLVRRVDIDPAAYPWLRWRWRVDSLVEKSSLHAKDTDDFSARLYVLFDIDIGELPFFERTKIRIARAIYGGDLPLAALCYVWATTDPVGTTAWNPFTDRVRVIVVASGGDQLRQWNDFERNVSDDYRAAFGKAPPHVSGIAIASDTDNTGGRALAFFGDIGFAATPRAKQP